MLSKKILCLICLSLMMGCSSVVKKIIPLNSLPKPSGEFAVGTVQFHWEDSSRKEWFSKEDTTDFREIMVQIWYPSDETPSGSANPYMDYLDLRVPEFSKQVELPVFMIKHISDISTQSYPQLRMAESTSKFPVLIFSHGLGGMRVQNTAYIEELVSHGFVVAAMDHSYDANITIFPNGHKKLYDSNLPKGLKDETVGFSIRYKQLDIRTKDVSFVLDELEKQVSDDPNSIFFQKLHLGNVGIFGHSFGGATSVSAAFHDSRISACLSLDGWFEILPRNILTEGLTKPFFHLGQEKWKKPLNYKNRDQLAENSTGPTWVTTFLGSKHFDYMDLPLFTKWTKKLNLTGTIEPFDFYHTLNEIQLTFFNHYIKDTQSFQPELIEQKSPFFKIEKSNPNQEQSNL